MAAAWYYDPETKAEGGLAFSTQPKPGGSVDPMVPGLINESGLPPYGKDYRDGAGGLRAQDALLWCTGGESDIETEGGELELSSTGGDPWTPPGVDTEHHNVLGDEPAVPYSYDDSNLYVAWSTNLELSEGDRFRAVFTWDKCTPTAISGPGSGPYSLTSVTEDFDLLCPDNNEDCIAASRSVYDNKEGFDVIVPADGDYDLLVVYDDDASSGCNGSYAVRSAIAVAYGSASKFEMSP